MVHSPINSTEYVSGCDAFGAIVDPSLELSKLVSNDQNIFWVNVGKVSSIVVESFIYSSEFLFVIAFVEELFNSVKIVTSFINERLSDVFPNTVSLSRHTSRSF